MAVTQSSGDGYALYNGIELPALPNWDKTLYPYVYITNGFLGIGRSYVCFQTIQYGANANGYYSLIIPAGTGMSGLYSDNQWSEPTVTTEDKSITIPNEAWIWANFDVLNEDGSVFLAATSPIPLDGMKVIEWDGDTIGLTAHSSKENYYAAATGSVDATTAQAVLSDGTISADGYLSEGGNIYLYSDGTTYTSLLAYTEAVEPPSGWTFNLQDFLNGLLCGLMSGRELKCEYGWETLFEGEVTLDSASNNGYGKMLSGFGTIDIASSPTFRVTVSNESKTGAVGVSSGVGNRYIYNAENEDTGEDFYFFANALKIPYLLTREAGTYNVKIERAVI